MIAAGLISILVFVSCDGRQTEGTRRYYFGTHGEISYQCEGICTFVIVSDIESEAVIMNTSQSFGKYKIKEVKKDGKLYTCTNSHCLILAESQVVEISVTTSYEFRLNWKAIKLCDNGKCKQEECTFPVFYSFGGSCLAIVNIVVLSYGCIRCHRHGFIQNNKKTKTEGETGSRRKRRTPKSAEVDKKTDFNDKLVKGIENFARIIRRLRNDSTYEVHRVERGTDVSQVEYSPLQQTVFTDIASVNDFRTNPSKNTISKNIRKNKKGGTQYCKKGMNEEPELSMRTAVSEPEIKCLEGSKRAESKETKNKMFQLRKSRSTDVKLNQSVNLKLHIKAKAETGADSQIDKNVPIDGVKEFKSLLDETSFCKVPVNEGDDGYLIPSCTKIVDHSHLNNTDFKLNQEMNLKSHNNAKLKTRDADNQSDVDIQSEDSKEFGPLRREISFRTVPVDEGDIPHLVWKLETKCD